MIITGLGNPGPEYATTRHNVGFLAVDALATRYKVIFASRSHRSLQGEFSSKGQRHLLLKPMTYMNLSGDAVSAVLTATGLTPPELLVIVDDVNLPLGRVRLRKHGNDGGHNGLKSIISHLGTQFWRLRIGIGQPLPDCSSHGNNLIEHVLGPMSTEETQTLEKVFAELPNLVSLWLIGRGTAAMEKFNGRNFYPVELEEKN